MKIEWNVESGLELTDAVRDRIEDYAKGNYSKEIVAVSIGRWSHPSGQISDLYVRVVDDSVLFQCEFPNYLMKEAIGVREVRRGRVGAALLTVEGSVYSSCEIHSENRTADYKPLSKVYSTVSGLQLIEDFLDTSTSIHAESKVIFDAIKNGETPKYLATTRMPCLSCCRIIRQGNISKTSYLSCRGDVKPADYFMSHVEQALSGVNLVLYAGVLSDDES